MIRHIDITISATRPASQTLEKWKSSNSGSSNFKIIMTTSTSTSTKKERRPESLSCNPSGQCILYLKFSGGLYGRMLWGCMKPRPCVTSGNFGQYQYLRTLHTCNKQHTHLSELKRERWRAEFLPQNFQTYRI